MRFLLILVVGGGVLIFIGGQEWWVSSGAGSTPAEVDLAKLEAGEALPNNYVKVGPHWALVESHVYSAKVGKFDKTPTPDSTVEYAYYPLISPQHPFFKELAAAIAKHGGKIPEDAGPEITQFRVLVKTHKYKKVRDLPQEPQQRESMEGLVVNAITSLGNKEEELIKQGFPQLDTKNLIIIEEDRKPASPLKSFGMMGGGLALIAAAGVIFLRSRNQ